MRRDCIPEMPRTRNLMSAQLGMKCHWRAFSESEALRELPDQADFSTSGRANGDAKKLSIKKKNGVDFHAVQSTLNQQTFRHQIDPRRQKCLGIPMTVVFIFKWTKIEMLELAVEENENMFQWNKVSGQHSTPCGPNWNRNG